MSRPRVLFLTPTPPYPPDNGGMLRIYSLVQRLAGKCDFSLLTFARRNGPSPFIDDAAALALRGVFSQVHCVPKDTTDLPQPEADSLPPIARQWRSAEMARTLRHLTSEGLVDVVHMEFLLMASYVRDVVGVPTVLTEHDLSHLSIFRSYFREWTGFGRLRKIPEWLGVRRYHKEVCRKSDRLIVLTQEDGRRLASVAAPKNRAYSDMRRPGAVFLPDGVR